jgi:carboxyl-terminal processing protease
VKRIARLAGAVLLATLAVAAQSPAPVDTFDAVWKIVRDTHFDPKMNGVDWNAVRMELRPRALAAADPAGLRAVIGEMLGRLGQSHFVLLPSTADSSRDTPLDAGGDPGFDVRLIGHDILVTSVDSSGGGAAAGVRTGWKVVAIDGTAVQQILGRLAPNAPERLLNVEAWRAIETRLRGPAGSNAALTFEDAAGKPVTLAVSRRPETGEPVTIGNLPTMHVRVESEERRTPGGGTAGVIGFNVWMPLVDSRFQRAMDDLRSSDGIVIDLRGNPGGLAGMIMGISGHFLTERTPLGVMKTRDSELKFAANPRMVTAAGVRVEPFAGPVAILVDAMSGSATECFAGGMQSIKRARVFGQTSMGQALPALFDKLPNGDVLIHAYGDFVTADGTRLEGRGVVPDEIVAVRREDLLAGKDATLDAALAWIDRSQHPNRGLAAAEKSGQQSGSRGVSDLQH